MKKFLRLPLEAWLILAYVLGLLAWASSEVHSFDIFWQLQSGKYILENGRFIYQDLFSLASEAPRYEHCWLHDVVFYWVHKLFNYNGVSLLKGGLITATAVTLLAVARSRGSSWLATLLVSPAVFLLTHWAWKERPQLWTYLLVGVFLWVLEKYRKQPGPQVFILLPIMVLWSNFHAGAIIAFPVVFAYLVAGGLNNFKVKNGWRKSPLKMLLITFLLLPVVSLINPYGETILETLAGSAHLGKLSGEIRQIYNIDWIATTYAGYPLYFIVVAITFVVMVLGWRAFALSDALLLAGLTFMGWRLERHTPFLFMAVAALLPAYVDAIGSSLKENFTLFQNRKLFRPVIILTALALFGYFAQPVWQQNGWFKTGLREWQYPVEEASFVKAQGLPPNLFNTYGIGGYLMWALYPEYKVFWDGRQDSEEMFVYGLQVRDARPGWEQVLEKFEVNTIILEACSQSDGRHFPLIDSLRNHPGWALVYAESTHLVFVRRNVVELDWLHEYQQPERKIDDAILRAASEMLKVGPLRKQALWEIARILASRGDYHLSEQYLTKYLAITPRSQQNFAAPALLKLIRLRQ